jgi:hypothetical protein
LLRTPEATINVFGTFDWVTKEAWLPIPRKQSEKDVTKELNLTKVISQKNANCE